MNKILFFLAAILLTSCAAQTVKVTKSWPNGMTCSVMINTHAEGWVIDHHHQDNYNLLDINKHCKLN